jgi:hypothetical protein
VFSSLRTAHEYVPDSFYKELGNTISDMTEQEKYKYIEEKVFEYRVYNILAWAIPYDFYGVLNDPRASEYIELFQARNYSVTPGEAWEIEQYRAFYTEAFDEFMAVQGYPAFLDNITHQAAAMLRMTMFVKPGTFEYRNTERTPGAYEPLKGTELEYFPSAGVNQVVKNYIADVMLILLTITAVIKLFNEEKRKGTLRLSLSMKNGRYALFINKAIAVFVFAVIITIAFVSAGLIIAELKYGLGNLHRPIQSVSGFIGANISVSVMQYLIIFTLTKILALFLIAIITILFCVLFGNAVLIYGGVAAIMGLTLPLYTQIPLTSWLAVFGRLNPIAFIEVNGIYENYYNFNLFSYPFNIIFLSLTFMLVLIAMLFIISMFLFPKRSGYNELPQLNFSDKLSVSSNLFLHESYKILISNKALLLIAVLVIIQYNSFASFKAYFDMDDFYFKRYINEIGGEVGSHTHEYIEKEQARFDKVFEEQMKLNLAYLSGDIDEFQYNAVNSMLIRELANMSAFSRLKARVDYIQNENPDAYLIYDTGYNKLVAAHDYRKDLELSLLLAVFLVLIIAPVFAADNEKGAVRIVASTKNGRLKNLFLRLIIVEGIAITATIVCFVPHVINILNEYGTEGINSPAQSVFALTWLGIDVSIKSYLFIVFAIRLLAAIVMAAFVTSVSILSKNNAESILISTTVIVLPIIISLIYAGGSPGISFTPLLGGNAVLRGSIINIIAVVSVCIIFYIKAARKVINNR